MSQAERSLAESRRGRSARSSSMATPSPSITAESRDLLRRAFLVLAPVLRFPRRAGCRARHAAGVERGAIDLRRADRGCRPESPFRIGCLVGLAALRLRVGQPAHVAAARAIETRSAAANAAAAHARPAGAAASRTGGQIYWLARFSRAPVRGGAGLGRSRRHR